MVAKHDVQRADRANTGFLGADARKCIEVM